jgi:hypothetical protein
MSDPEPDKASVPAAKGPSRSSEAARRLSQLLSRPFGTPAPPGEAPEPYVPRPARVASPPPAPAPPDDTASASPRPVAPSRSETHVPWFDRAVPSQAAPEPISAHAPSPAPEPAAESEHIEPLSAAPAPDDLLSEAPPQADDDLFDRGDPPRHAPAEPADEPWPFDRPAHHAADERAGAHAREPERVPEWAWPSALDRAPEAAAPRPEPLAAPEPFAPDPLRPAPSEPAAAAPSTARPLDPDATRALGNIRRLMLASNLFMVVAIGVVLAVVGYRIYRTEPAHPPAVAAPAPPKIPVDMTLTLPRGARIMQTAIAGDRLVITIQIDGATEIRTFDIKTLQPTGRLSFATVP